MSQQSPVSQWVETVSTHLPKLSRPQAKVLAYWSFGMVLAKSCGITLVCAALALQLGCSEASLLQRLREWCYSAKDKKGHKRRELDVSTCFGPLVQWILAWWPADEPRLALAVDATTLSNRFTVLVISVVYRGCAIPVAWKVVGALEKGAWQPHWLKLLEQLRDSVPTHWTVIVMSDRGLYAPWLYAKIVSLGWHPFMRINKQGNFRPKGDARFRSLATAAPSVGSAWCGVVDCFSQETSPLQCTLLARWDEGYEEVWLIVTDLAPAQASAVWYSMRSWIEGGFKDTKRAGWGWHQTKMTDPERAERLWLAIAVATLWVLSVGGQADANLEAEQLGGSAPDPCGSSSSHETVAPTHAQLFCPWHPHHCRSVDPRGWIGRGSLRAGTVANHALGSQKEEPQGQDSSGSGGGLMKNLLVKDGTPGEIWTRSPWQAEYYNQPEATRKSMRDGFFSVGDIAYRDSEGYYYICDRKIDMVISGGVNIYPAEIEAVLAAHPAVADVAVIGVPDDHWGEAVKAVVELQPGKSTSAEELIAFCAERLADYKKPRSVDFVDELPRSPAGKLLKNQIRERYWAGTGRKI